ncbi:MAG TPA: hypothetical protein DGC76_02215, partial [Candidatus Accumulibacter sp.]|nr:hypothetical protein [Accumulibacter sp.]
MRLLSLSDASVSACNPTRLSQALDIIYPAALPGCASSNPSPCPSAPDARCRFAHVVTDLEGRRDAIDDLVDAGRLSCVGGALDFVDPNDRLYFAGDVTDRGPFTIRLVEMLLALKRRHPDRVAWAYGNLDLKNLALLRDLPGLALGTPDYEAWLRSQPDTADTTAVAGVPLGGESGGCQRGERDSLDRRIAYWLTRQGSSQAFEFHQRELAEMRGHPVSRQEAADDYIARLQPG